MRLFTEKGVRLATGMPCQPRSTRVLRHSFFVDGAEGIPDFGFTLVFEMKNGQFLENEESL